MIRAKTKGPIESRCVQCTALWANQMSNARMSLSFLQSALISCLLYTNIL